MNNLKILCIEGINDHLVVQKMVLKLAMEDKESKITAVKAVAESGGINLHYLIAYDAKKLPYEFLLR